MSTRHNEPPWLTAIFVAVGFAVIAAGVFVTYLFVTYWLLFLALAIGGAAFYWHTRSPAALERRAREKTAALLRQLAALDTDFPTANDFSTDLIKQVMEGRSVVPNISIVTRFIEIVEGLYTTEAFTLAAIPEPPPLLDTIEGAQYREFLMRQHAKLADRPAFDAFRAALVETLADFSNALPPVACVAPDKNQSDRSPALSVPLTDTLPNLAQQVEDLILPFYTEKARSLGLFAELRNQIDRNLHEASGVPFTQANKDSPKLVMPTEYKGENVVHAYLHNTPLEDIFAATVAFEIPEQARFEHTHILAGSGHGKTQTLQHLILSDLSRPDPPSLIIIDSQGDMLRKLSRLSLFDQGGALADRLIIINPTDIEHPPALNMFDVNFDRLGGYNPAAREQILNGVIELYDYIFGSLLGAELTQKQSVIFRYLARLMLTIPGATIHTLIELMGDITPYTGYIAQLPPGARMFFETEFPHKSFTDTKRQIQRRLWGILENPTFERMLTAPNNRIDMFDALNTGKIVLVNTAKDFLKAERSSFLGRLFIALTLQAALERAALPEGKRRPAFLYIDEAADYFDDNIDDLLTQARKYNLGVVFSHQYLGQLAPPLHSSIASNTSIKMAGGVSDRDARSMAPDMRTTPTVILEQRKSAASTQFACYVRNMTPNALSLTIPFGQLERQPTMTAAAYRRLENHNRSRISVAPSEPPVRLHAPDLPSKREPSPQPVQGKPTPRAAPANVDDWSS